MGIADQELIKRRPWVKFYDVDTLAEIRYPKFAVQDMLRNTATMFPDKVAIWFYGNEITFGNCIIQSTALLRPCLLWV